MAIYPPPNASNVHGARRWAPARKTARQLSGDGECVPYGGIAIVVSSEATLPGASRTCGLSTQLLALLDQVGLTGENPVELRARADAELREDLPQVVLRGVRTYE